MYLSEVKIRGYRAAANNEISVSLPGRFSLIMGANGSGKTTINEAIVLAHPKVFPRLARIDATALGISPRSVEVKYQYEPDDTTEGVFAKQRRERGISAPEWKRTLERYLGAVKPGEIEGSMTDANAVRLVYLPAMRNPVDDLSRRDSRVLLELLRAASRQGGETKGLSELRSMAEGMLNALVKNGLVQQVEHKINQQLHSLSVGVSEHHAYMGIQTVDDRYLARIFEMLLAIELDRSFAKRLEVSSLGYVNLLHIAITLAGIPDLKSEMERMQDDISQGGQGAWGQRSESEPTLGMANSDSVYDTEVLESSAQHYEDEDEIKRREEAAQAECDADSDSFFPETFHATVLIEEPEAHLHPQLQYGLIRYLRRLVKERPDVQVIVTTHSSELAAACDPTELVVVRRDSKGQIAVRQVAEFRANDKDRSELLQKTRLHLAATHSAAFFADRLLIVEGVTEAILLRQFGRIWAGDDENKASLVESLTILSLGHRVGKWPMLMLASEGYNLVGKVAALADTDRKGDKEFKAPRWHSELDSSVGRYFWSDPTLEPSLLEGNEDLVRQALMSIGWQEPSEGLTKDSLRQHFIDKSGTKGNFALALSALLIENPEGVVVPSHIAKMFDWLFLSEETYR